CSSDLQRRPSPPRDGRRNRLRRRAGEPALSLRPRPPLRARPPLSPRQNARSGRHARNGARDPSRLERTAGGIVCVALGEPPLRARARTPISRTDRRFGLRDVSEERSDEPSDRGEEQNRAPLPPEQVQGTAPAQGSGQGLEPAVLA